MKQFSLIVLLICASLTTFGQTEAECSQTVTGEVRDGISTDVLVGAEVILTDESGAIVATQTIKEDGAFSFTINCETSYKIEGIQEDYTAESKTFTTTNEDKRELKLIVLLDKGDIDFVTDGEANAKAIDSVARAEIEVPEITPNVVVEEIEEQQVQQEVVKEEKVPVKIVRTDINQNNLKIAPIYFDYESSWLNQKAKNDLQKLVNMMKKNPKMVVACAAHADAKGEFKYNQWMSDRRAKRAIDFIVSKGISVSRISGKGFGETLLVNDCTNEKECTNEQRAVNRRVEFVIVKM